MAEKILLTCDKIGRGKKVCGEEAHTYVISGPEGEWEIDLCGLHADALYGVAQREGRLSTRANPSRRTMDDATRPWLEDRL